MTLDEAKRLKEQEQVDQSAAEIAKLLDDGYFERRMPDAVSMEVIEAIREEIKKTLDADWSDGLYRALKIIDRHIGKGKE